MKRKWIIITGGILSGLGKGTAAAAIGRLLKNSHKIVAIKCDGYLNVDPGTINPIEHGEVFVLDDGGEVDMDFGHYERFLDINCKFRWNLTSGKIFKSVIDKERKGEYLGKTIQIFPHIIDEIKERFLKISEDENSDITLVEIGGTVGDIENSWFIEAVRQLKKVVGEENIIYTHLTYIPFLDSVGEVKTKPAQRDIALMREVGITPDIVVARSKDIISKKIKHKLARFFDMDEEQIISGRDIESIYEIPLIFESEGMGKIIREKLNINENVNDNDGLKEWKALVNNIKNPNDEVTVAVCGKYTELKDSYASIIEALTHAGAHLNIKVNLQWIETTDIEDGSITPEEALKGVKGIIVPGGFGKRGVEGKISLIRHVRENNIPFLGICYGLQLAVVEYARNVHNLNAHSTEIKIAEHPVIDILPEQKGIDKKGGTMRLGAYKAILKKDTKTYELYRTNEISERHRHRYEVNPAYHSEIFDDNLIISGASENGRLVEFIELRKHPFFIATQAHPELKSRLLRPAPLFYGFIKSCVKADKIL